MRVERRGRQREERERDRVSAETRERVGGEVETVKGDKRGREQNERKRETE